MDLQELEAIAEKATVLAGQWQNRANEFMTEEEKGIQEQMLRLLTHPMDKIVLTKMIDQSFRSHNPARVADQINSILRHMVYRTSSRNSIGCWYRCFLASDATSRP